MTMLHFVDFLILCLSMYVLIPCTQRIQYADFVLMCSYITHLIFQNTRLLRVFYVSFTRLLRVFYVYFTRLLRVFYAYFISILYLTQYYQIKDTIEQIWQKSIRAHPSAIYRGLMKYVSKLSDVSIY